MPRITLPANTWTALPDLGTDTWVQTRGDTYVDTVGATPALSDATPMPENASMVFATGITVSLNPGSRTGHCFVESI